MYTYPITPPGHCPHCGRCPHCGSPYFTTPAPYYGQPYVGTPYPLTVGGGTTIPLTYDSTLSYGGTA